MFLELTTAGIPVLVNTDLVANWIGNDEGTLIEFPYDYHDDSGAIGVRTIQVEQAYDQIMKVLRAHQSKPDAVVTLPRTRR